MPRAKQPKRRTPSEDSAVGFVLHLELRPGLPLAECRRFLRRLGDYAEDHEIQLEGTQLRHLVSAPRRELSVDDQVALLDWLVDQPGVVSVRLGPIGRIGALHEQHDHTGQGAAFVHARTVDVAWIGLTLLYRCARITPTLYLQILGGSMRPAHLH